MFVQGDENERQRSVTDALMMRINTREASTLLFSTVASSASLMFLIPMYQGNIPSQWRESVKWIGFLFSLLGLIYREITIHTSDRIDYQALRARLREPLPSPNWFWIITRGSVVRFFLIVPIIGWLITLGNSSCFSTLTALMFIISMMLSVVEFLGRDP